MNVNNAHFIADAKLLLPWRATGRLSAAEVDVIENAFALAPELQDDLVAARLERQAIIAVNELASAPSSRALEDLLAQIEREATPRKSVSRLWGWVAPATWSPRALAWSAGVAALMCLLQAGLLTVLLTGRGAGSSPDSSSRESPSELKASWRSERVAPGTEIRPSRPFDRYRCPSSGTTAGLYRVKVPDGEGRESARRMSEERGVVEFAAPVE